MTRREKSFLVGACVFLLCAGVLITLAGDSVRPQQEQTDSPTNEALDRGNTDLTRTESSAWDVSALNGWCGELTGTTRMVGAWWYNYEPTSGITVVEDETGELWCLREGEAIGEDDFLLLWINDNGTPHDVEDDTVVKVWAEVHE